MSVLGKDYIIFRCF